MHQQQLRSLTGPRRLINPSSPPSVCTVRHPHDTPFAGGPCNMAARLRRGLGATCSKDRSNRSFYPCRTTNPCSLQALDQAQIGGEGDFFFCFLSPPSPNLEHQGPARNKGVGCHAL